MTAATLASALAVTIIFAVPAEAMFAASSPEALRAKATKNDVIPEGSRESHFVPNLQSQQPYYTEMRYILDAVRR